MLARLTTRRLFSLIASGVLTAAAVSFIHAAEAQWPRFHGPNGDNISRETGLLKSWPEDGPNLLWRAEGIGEGYATVAIANGLIYTAGNKDDKTMITALELSGKQVWQKPVGPAWTRDYPGTRATPTIADGRLYYETPLGDVVCLNAKDGEKIWSVNILEKFGAENIRWGLSESIVLDGDRLICCPGGPVTAVVALKRSDGSLVWKSPSVGDATAYATPRIAEFAGVRMVLTLTAKAILAVNADNGELLFRHPHETSYDVNVLTPIVHDGQVFVSTGYGRGSVSLRLKSTGGKIEAEQAWESKEMDNHHGGVILLDGHLYGTTQNKNRDKLVCLEWKTGEMRWAEKMVGKGAITYADGLFYCWSEKGLVGLVKASPEGAELISKFKIPEGGEGPTWAHPVVCGGRLYLRHGDVLFVYDVKAR